MAPTLSEGPVGWPGGRTAAWPASYRFRRAGRASDRATLGATPADAAHWSTRSMAERRGFPSRRCHVCGVLSDSSHTARRHSDCRRIRSSSTRSTTSSASASTRLSVLWCCVWMRSRRSRPWTGPSRSCQWCPGCRSGPPAATSGSAPPPCLPRSTPPPARSSDPATAATARRGSRSSSRSSTKRAPPDLTSISSAATTRPTRPQTSRNGSWPALGSTCTSHPQDPPG